MIKPELIEDIKRVARSIKIEPCVLYRDLGHKGDLVCLNEHGQLTYIKESDYDPANFSQIYYDGCLLPGYIKNPNKDDPAKYTYSMSKVFECMKYTGRQRIERERKRMFDAPYTEEKIALDPEILPSVIMNINSAGRLEGTNKPVIFVYKSPITIQKIWADDGSLIEKGNSLKGRQIKETKLYIVFETVDSFGNFRFYDFEDLVNISRKVRVNFIKPLFSCKSSATINNLYTKDLLAKKRTNNVKASMLGLASSTDVYYEVGNSGVYSDCLNYIVDIFCRGLTRRLFETATSRYTVENVLVNKEKLTNSIPTRVYNTYDKTDPEARFGPRTVDAPIYNFGKSLGQNIRIQGKVTELQLENKVANKRVYGKKDRSAKNRINYTKKLYIPTIKKIGKGCFKNKFYYEFGEICEYDNLEVIGSEAFFNCMLDTLPIGPKIKKISARAFEIETEIYGERFPKCYRTRSLLEIPESCEFLGTRCFAGQRFSTLVIRSQNIRITEKALEGIRVETLMVNRKTYEQNKEQIEKYRYKGAVVQEDSYSNNKNNKHHDDWVGIKDIIVV